VKRLLSGAECQQKKAMYFACGNASSSWQVGQARQRAGLTGHVDEFVAAIIALSRIALRKTWQVNTQTKEVKLHTVGNETSRSMCETAVRATLFRAIPRIYAGSPSTRPAACKRQPRMACAISWHMVLTSEYLFVITEPSACDRRRAVGYTSN
jgi:hypothetical protein